METNKLFSYWWGHEDTEDGLIIYCYGLNEKDESVLLRVHGFTPYVYLELNQDVQWTKSILMNISHDLKSRFSNIHNIKYTRCKKLFYNHKTLDTENNTWNDKLYQYLYITFKKKSPIYSFEKIMRTSYKVKCINKNVQFKIHENNASPILQYTCQQNIPTANWIKFVGTRVKQSNQISKCNYEYICRASDLQPLHGVHTVPNACIMAFDIEANSTNPDRMPNSKLSGDKIFQISCCIGYTMDKEPKHNILITLGKVNPALLDDKIQVIECENEGDLLLSFTQIIQKYNPQIITGYNIFNFDIPYMIDRSRMNNVYYDFIVQGYTDKIAVEKEIKWSSTAYKNQNFKYLDAHGRLYVDMLPIIQRDYKLDNYKLKTVSDMFVGETKDPLTPKDIFKCYKMGMKQNAIGKNALSIVGKYCVQDSSLVFKLFNITQTWVGLVEMATTCNVPIFTLYTQGQQIKVFSQIYKVCMKQNIVVEKDGYICDENEKLTGAIVLDPIPGIYDKITPFDFTSLYPTTIIAYNLCFSTLVKDDDDVDDKYCHVIDYSEHKFCIANGTPITLSNYSIPIEDLDFTEDNKLITYSIPNETIEYQSKSKLIKSGYKKCIKLKFEDGKTLICTPEHRILNRDSEWIMAKDVKINSFVKKAIRYPLYNFKYFISDFKVYIGTRLYSMDTYNNIEDFLRFVRLLGFIRIHHTNLHDYNCVVASELDAKNIINDVYLLTGMVVDYTFDGKTYIVRMPVVFHMNVLNKYYIGNIPKFLLYSNCPSILQQEFIAGVFGSDECTVVSLKNSFQIGISLYKEHSTYQSVPPVMWIKRVLNEFNINSRLSFSNTHLTIDDEMSIHKFSEYFGYRYNTHKQYKLNVVDSYISTVNNRLSSSCMNMIYNRKMKFTKYLKLYSAEHLFNDTGVMFSIPTICTKLVSVEEVGEYPVFDITVTTNHNFVANGIVVHNCEHDTKSEINEKNKICQDRRYRFLKEPKGIVPTLLQDLLNARSQTRKKQKQLKQQMSTLHSLSNEYKDLQLLYDVLEKRQLAYKVSANSVYGAYGTKKGYLPFLPGAQCTTALGRMNIQKAAKYIQRNYGAKLVYGDSVTGDTPVLIKLADDSIDIIEIQHLGKCWVSYEEFKPDIISESKEQCYIDGNIQIWTLNGWKNIKRVVRHYTDKKLFNVLTHKGFVTVTEDHSLITKETFNYVKPIDVHENHILLHHDWPRDVFEFDVFIKNKMCETEIELTYNDGWFYGFCIGSNAECKDNFFQLVSTCLPCLDKICNLNKSLKRQNVITVTCNDEKFINTYRKMIYQNGVPYCILNSDHIVKNGFLEGYLDANENIFKCHSKLIAQGIYYILRSIGISDITVQLTMDNHIHLTLLDSLNAYTHVNEILEQDEKTYVYDIETDDGTFHAGVGELIVKNTDSVYVNFPEKSQGSFEELWDFCEDVEKEINSLFIKPLHLSFESAIYDRFFILTKKRYICLKADRNGNISDKLMIRGVLLTRRDNADIVREIYKKTTMSIFYKEDVSGILDVIYDHIHKMFTREHDLKKYVITKSIGNIADYKFKPLPDDNVKRIKRLKELQCTTEDDYKLKSLPANIQLAEKMRRRGKIVSDSQRLEYVITNPGKHLAKQFDKIEDYEYAKEHSDIIQIDPLYYLKLMSKPLDEILNVGVKVNDFVIKQYKWRLQKYKCIEELKSYNKNMYRIILN